MSNFIVIEKDSLSKSTVNTSQITLTEASIVHTKMHRDDVAEFVRDGNNLVLKLQNGEVIVIENFFVKFDDVASDLVFEDDGCVLYWFDGVSGFKEIAGLEVLLPEASSTLGGLTPWLVGGGIAGLIGGIAGADGSDDDEPAAPPVEKPQVSVEITPEGQIILTYPDDTDPQSINTGTVVVEGPNGPVMVEFGPPEVQPDGTVVVTGQVPEGIDGTVTVTVPDGSYEDVTGNPGKPGADTGTVDTDRPQVSVEITPEGQIILTYPDDTDPQSINTGTVVVEGPNGPVTVDFGPPEVQPDGTVVVTGQVPEGIDGTVTVTVPEGSYEDVTGNPGKPGADTGTVDTDRPQVSVEITPEGQIILTYPDDTDPQSINTGTVVVEGPNGPVTVDFGPPEVQPDGTVVVTGQVPEGIDGTVTVTVPEGSYEDVTGNPGKTGTDNDGQGSPVDTVAPEVTVDIAPNPADSSKATAVFTFTEAIDPASFSSADLIVTGGKIIGQPVYDSAAGTWSVELKVEPGETVTVEVKAESYTDLTGNAGAPGEDKLITVKITGVTPDTDENGSAITVITGKTEPGNTVVVTLPDGTELPAVTAGADGSWTVETAVPLLDGESLTASTTDQDSQPIQDTVELPLIYINVIAGDDVINEDELAALTGGNGLFPITGTVSNPAAEIKVTVNGVEYSVDPSDITPQGQWTLNIPVSAVIPDMSISAVAKTPTVTSEPAVRNPSLDNEAPTVAVDITEQGRITVKFVPDVDISSIDPAQDFIFKMALETALASNSRHQKTA